MQSLTANRAQRAHDLAYRQHLLADNTELLSLYAECMDMTPEALLAAVRADLRDEDFADHLTAFSERWVV